MNSKALIINFMVIFWLLEASCMRRKVDLDENSDFKPYYKPLPEAFKKPDKKLDPNAMPRKIKINDEQ